MNLITKVYFKTKDELLNKRFYLFNQEIIMPYKEYEKLEKNIVESLIVQNNCFTFSDEEVK